jgi:hypothetical protein
MAELWLRSLQLPEIETSTRFSFELYQIHHCLPCTYGQTIAPLHTRPSRLSRSSQLSESTSSAQLNRIDQADQADRAKRAGSLVDKCV